MNTRHARRVMQHLYGRTFVNVRGLNVRHVQARSRAMIHFQMTQLAEIGDCSNLTLVRAGDHQREMVATMKWFGWRGLGFTPAQIVGGAVEVSDLSREMDYRGATTPPW